MRDNQVRLRYNYEFNSNGGGSPLQNKQRPVPCLQVSPHRFNRSGNQNQRSTPLRSFVFHVKGTRGTLSCKYISCDERYAQ